MRLGIYTGSHKDSEGKRDMKKVIKTVVFCIILVAIGFLYGHIAKLHNIYDKNIDTSEYQSTEILSNKGVRQTFVCEEEYLDGVRIKSIVSNSSEDTQIHYQLINMEENQVVSSGTIQGKDVENSKFFEISFARVTGSKGKTFELFLYSDSSSDEKDGVKFSYQPVTEEGTSFVEADKEITEGTLILKTVTNRFDWETFIVFLGFALYVILFMRFLYNLFK